MTTSPPHPHPGPGSTESRSLGEKTNDGEQGHPDPTVSLCVDSALVYFYWGFRKFVTYLSDATHVGVLPYDESLLLVRKDGLCKTIRCGVCDVM